jgi:hypothetical protein
MKSGLSTLIIRSISIYYLFIPSLTVSQDLKLPKAETVIKADINGNGIPDRIVATYFSRPVLILDRKIQQVCQTVPGKFVRYTMYPDGQKNGKVIFEEGYGNNLYSYWSHQLEIGPDLNRDGRTDLVFNMGDDTSSGTTHILQKSSGFKAISIGISDHPGYQIDAQRSLVSPAKEPVAKWDRSTEVWKSNQIGWVKGDCVAIRTNPNLQSKITELVFDQNVLLITQTTSSGDWIAVLTDNGDNGWISKKHFSFSAPVRWFK